MPLDRRITITQYVSEPRDEHGETDRVIVATYRVYATVYPKSQLATGVGVGAGYVSEPQLSHSVHSCARRCATFAVDR